MAEFFDPVIVIPVVLMTVRSRVRKGNGGSGRSTKSFSDTTLQIIDIRRRGEGTMLGNKVGMEVTPIRLLKIKTWGGDIRWHQWHMKDSLYSIVVTR